MTLFHLIGNAIKFTDSSGGPDDIVIRLTMVYDNNEEYMLETKIIDKGIGIEETILASLNKELMAEDDAVSFGNKISRDNEESMKIGFGLKTAKTLAKA